MAISIQALFVTPAFAVARLGGSTTPLHAYDWIKKSGTQYYFRYEGSQGVPPCLEVVHWRVMKDSIRVPCKQILQLEQLVANRVNPTSCLRETAGRPRQVNNTNLVEQ